MNYRINFKSSLRTVPIYMNTNELFKSTTYIIITLWQRLFKENTI